MRDISQKTSHSLYVNRLLDIIPGSGSMSVLHKSMTHLFGFSIKFRNRWHKHVRHGVALIYSLMGNFIG